MASLDEKFNKLCEDVKKISKRPQDGELLELYSLYKQSTVGDNTTPKPGALDLKSKAKWETWVGKRGLSKEDAKAAYIAKAEYLIQQYS